MTQRKKSILIVDDNKDLLSVLDLVLTGQGWKVAVLSSPNQLSSELHKNQYDVILLDMNFQGKTSSGNEGLFWLSEVQKIDQDQAVVMITAYGDINLAVRSLQEGAVDFIDKAWDQQKILSTLEAAWQISISKRQIRKLKSQRNHLSSKLSDQSPIYWGNSASIREVKALIEKVGKTDASVLILGENGTGKELVAQEIHRSSGREDEVFISVDMGSIPTSLFESEMFGYEKGAFTGALKAKAGRMFLADGGTLFLDEIGNLNHDLQSKLLRVLETHQIIPLGGQKIQPVDFRLITATNSPLPDQVNDGVFRQDLFYRLNTITITLPPLRERRDDIRGLITLFLEIYNNKHSRSFRIKDSDITILEKQPWPGNIRQLKHSIERAVILSDGQYINLEQTEYNNGIGLIQSRTSLNLADTEKKLISQALSQSKGNITKTAELLGINRSTVYDKIKKYGL
ncbi:MAG: sigma-54-dependent Fis family transcriptional regulator [Bacteroidetes bacterium]|jgi:two-component system, NtrC family, response regulator HydG|nr:sigma-54-dependent Fis family transcriptional regulator [Bacteroidota bacterium]MBT4399667.1 sigma-54-dependent Fis family transcriptional regulator [Bacteroidota bacterium]MBT4409554.1 sigma-54-dependent Fis family transcriptional regulator [Bacteroidota bacterium]